MKFILRLKPWLQRKDLVWWLAGLAVLLSLPSLFGGFATDDHNFRMVFQDFPGLPELSRSPLDIFHYYTGTDVESTLQRMDRGLAPWWAYEEGRFRLMRPFSALTHWIDYLLFRDAAWPMHLHNILLFGCIAALITRLYRRLDMTPWVAGLAALLYIVDDARSLPVGWISGRNSLLTLLFGLLLLLAHDKWRRDGWKPGPYLAVACLILGLLSGEATLSVGAYLLAYVLFIDRAGPWKRMASLIPYGAVVVLWAGVYKYYDFGVTGSAAYSSPLGDPRMYLEDLVQHIPLMLFGQFGLPDCTFWAFLPPMWSKLYFICTVISGVFFVFVLWPVVRHDRMARFWTLGMLLALLPACASTPQDRLLAYVGIGAAALLALFFKHLHENPPWMAVQGPWRKAASVTACCWVGIHLVLSPILLTVGTSSIAIVEAGVRRANNSVPMAPSIQDEAVVFIYCPNALLSAGLPILRASLRQPVPQNTWVLSAGNTSVKVERPDARTLVVTPEGGFIIRPSVDLFRQIKRFPVQEGYSIQLSSMKIEVLEVTPDGRPAVARYSFSKALEHSTLHWLVWDDGAYAPYILPDVRETDSIEGPAMARLIGSVLNKKTEDPSKK
jgi:hypothetical protein